LSLLSTPVGAGALLAGAVAGVAWVGGGAVEAAGDTDPAKAGDEAACPEAAGAGAVADESQDEDEDEDGADDAEEPDAADEEATPDGVEALPDPYPVDVLRGANELPASSMIPSTAPVSSVIVGVSSFTSACTRGGQAGVQRRR
jgi:hypothetical protein